MPTSATDQQRDGSAPSLPGEARDSRVDAGDPASVSFAARIGDAAGQRAPSSRSGGREDDALVGVGPGMPGAMLLGGRAGLLGMNPFPIVGARIHPPLMRADTLSRERLNGWLDQAATGRVALVVAEAGFGKTTLLGDWARNSPRLTAWYRLDPDDRDWLTFDRHLVAGGRELDPDFAPDTYALLMQLGPGGPTREDIQASLVREYAEFSASHPQGLTLILDDYHAVDGSDEVVPTVRALIERTGPGFSIVIASRSTPRLPLGRLRARGAVSRIGGDALCFDVPETDRLFRDAYHLPIEPDVVDELVERTEGWAALLSLVNVTLGEQGRPDARALVSHISANQGDLYDFLAEEVVGSLAPALHAFLTRVSILTWVDVETAGVVCNMGRADISAAINDAEGLGLLTQPDRDTPYRFHPLVRAFLLAQLAAEIGDQEVLSIHSRVAHALEGTDWATAAWHFRAAGDQGSAARVVDAAIDSVFASGQFERARPFVDGSAGSAERAGVLILRSRLELARGGFDHATELAQLAVPASRGGNLEGQALLNLSSILGFGGIEAEAVRFAEEALRAGLAASQRDVAIATVAMWDAEHEGALDAIADEFRDLAARQSRDGHHRYAGITRLNLSNVLLWLGEPREAATVAAQAQLDLGGRAVGSAEFVAAVSAEASALAPLGELDRAQAILTSVLDIPSRLGRGEVQIETAKLMADYGHAEIAATALEQATSQGLSTLGNLASLIRGTLAIRRNQIDVALKAAAELAERPCSDVAGLLRGQLLRSRASLLAGAKDASMQLDELDRIATAQRSRPVMIAVDMLRAVERGGPISMEVARISPDDRYCLSLIAEEVTSALDRLAGGALEIVTSEALRRPERWASALRLGAATAGPAGDVAASLLAELGGSDDAELLRSLATHNKALKPAASAIARRLAPKVEIADLGVVEVLVNDVALTRRLRRKVLGLLCFVSSRPGMGSTRDEALEALWPDLAPGTAVNSLHQTIYFLRRLLEPDYREGLGAGYVLFDGEVLSLDPSLVDSRSRRTWRLLAAWQRGDRAPLAELLATYTGKFALDFSYDEWATAYRENLHAAVLAAVEEEVAALIRVGNADRAITVAQQILLVDPSADGLELQLLRAYKQGGRLAAAAEQYQHYSSTIREELGVEPPNFADI